MTLTLSGTELLQEVKFATAQRADVPDAQIFRALNIAQERIFRKPVQWPESERFKETNAGFLSGDDTAQASALVRTGDKIHDLYSVRYRADEEWYKLKYISPLLWDQYDDRYTSVYPAYYTRWGQTISIYPAAGQDLDMRLRYTASPQLINANTTDMMFDTMSGILVEYAVSHILHGAGRVQEASIHYRIADQQVTEAMMNVPRVTDDVSLVSGTGPVGEYWLDPFVRAR